MLQYLITLSSFFFGTFGGRERGFMGDFVLEIFSLEVWGRACYFMYIGLELFCL